MNSGVAVSSPNVMGTTITPIRTGLRIGLYALLLFAPLAFGATEPWSNLVLHVSAALLFIVWCFIWRPPANGETGLFGIALPALLFFGFIVAAQILLGTSAYRQATIFEFLDYTAYAMIFVVAADTVLDDNRLVRLTDFVIVFSFALAVFAIVQELSGTERLYWLRLPSYRLHFFGPYVNRNHYAGLMEMLFPFVLTASMYRRFSPGRRSLAAFTSLVVAGSVVLSRSRTGAVIIVFQVIVLAVARLDRRHVKLAILITTVAAVVFVGFAYWIGAQGSVERFGSLLTGTDESALMRMHIAADSVKLIAQRPVFGWGAGTFPYIYSAFRTFQTDLWVNQAHNDVLQVLIETGLIGFLCIGVFVADVFRRGTARARRVYDLGAPVVTAALVGIGGLLLHSFLDFNLHIPANAAWFFFLCGLVVGGDNGSRVAERKRVARTLDEHGTLQATR